MITVTPVSPGTDPDLPYGGVILTDEAGNQGKLSNGAPGPRGAMGPQAIQQCNCICRCPCTLQP